MISSSFKECFLTGPHEATRRGNPLPGSGNAALVSCVALSQNQIACDGVLSCVTLSHMAKHISIRLWDDVLEAVDKLAAVEERDRSQVINRTLRQSLGVAKIQADQAKTQNFENVRNRETVHASEKISERQRKACQHGNDPLSCKMPACRQARG